MKRKNDIDLWGRLKKITQSQYNKLLGEVSELWYNYDIWDMDDFYNALDNLINWNTFFPWLYVSKWGDWDFGDTYIFLWWSVETPEWFFDVRISDWFEWPPNFEVDKDLADYMVSLWEKYLNINSKFRAMTSHIKYTYVK